MRIKEKDLCKACNLTSLSTCKVVGCKYIKVCNKFTEEKNAIPSMYYKDEYIGFHPNRIWSDEEQDEEQPVKRMTLDEYIDFLSSLRDEVGGDTDVCVDEDGESAKEPAVTNFQGYKFVILNY